jgi:hypothetical protein
MNGNGSVFELIELSESVTQKSFCACNTCKCYISTVFVCLNKKSVRRRRRSVATVEHNFIFKLTDVHISVLLTVFGH